MKLPKQAMNAVLFAWALTLAGQKDVLASAIRPVAKLKPRAVATRPVVGAGKAEVVTAATGGEAIRADTAGAAWTTLTGPIITETYARDTGGPGLGTIVLKVPAGFEFNPAAPVAARINADGKKTINGFPDGDSIPAVVTPSTVTITISSVGRGGLAFPDTLTFQNIQVRPTAGNLLASGNITESGTYEFRGLTLNSGSWGLLQETRGVVANVILADPLGDPDGDGRSNLIEYAVGTDPTNPADSKDGMNVWITNDSGNRYLTLGYKQRVVPGFPLVYQPEVSGDKQTWYSDAAHVLSLSISSVDAQFNWVTVRDTVPLTPSTARFIRLTVIEN